MQTISAMVCVVLLLFGTATAIAAQDVTLTSRDGGVEVSGNLLGFDGEFYRIDTIYGELTVDGSGVVCEGPGCPNLTNFVADLQISGARGLASMLMPALVEAFAVRNGYRSELNSTGAETFTLEIYSGEGSDLLARLNVVAATTDEGFADLLADQADIVVAAREIRPDERTRAREAGLGDLYDANRSRVLALDAIVPVVSLGNTLNQIAPADLARIVAGEVTRWSELGGPDAPIVLHIPDPKTGFGQAIEDLLMTPLEGSPPNTVTYHASVSEVSRAVRRDPFALGMTSYSEVGSNKPLSLTGGCGYSLDATRLTIKMEDYPLTAPNFVYLPARRLPKIGREFLAFLRSPAAQLVIRRAGFVDQTPEEISIDQQGQRLANAIAQAGPEIRLEELQRMVNTLGLMRRLTTSFRFEAGSVRLDAQSRSNVAQLARALERGTYDARRLLFVGFSDGDGAAEANRNIALRRAEAVRRAVISAAETIDIERVSLDVDAFGEALPMACDDSSWGRQANRRVEVWIR